MRGWRLEAGGLTLVEILMAVLVLALFLLPLVGLMTKGFSDTQATIQEVQASNLASELVEQLDSVPFAALPAAASPARLGSSDATLDDGTRMGPDTPHRFHLSPLPRDFSRVLTLRRASDTRVEAVATIRWKARGFDRELSMQRLLVKDEVLPTL